MIIRNDPACFPVRPAAADESQYAEISLSSAEVAAIAHALREAYNAIQRTKGDQYGPLALDDLERLAKRFEKEASFLPRQ